MRAHTERLADRNRRALAALVGIALLAVGAQAATGRLIVRQGDTLSGIAARSGVSIGALASANGIGDVNRIRAGQVLSLPGHSGGGSAAVATGGRYLVRRGDTLSRIAAEQRVDVRALASANGIDDVHRIFAGTWLRLPAGGAAAPVPASPAASSTSVYEVRAGDNLSTIARRFGLSVRTLAEANGIGNVQFIRIGARLSIPVASGGSAAAASGRLPARLAADPSRQALLPIFDRWAGAYGVPADLLKSMAWMESGFQNGVRSSTGAMGVGQLMPDTVDFVSDRLLGVRLNPWNPEENIRMSARYLRWLLDRTGGNEARALAAYYQGLRSVTTRGLFTDTLAYVQGIAALRSRFF